MGIKYDIAIIGAGPGGYVAAIRGAQLGKKVVLIERDELGGTCMNWGCIPTKYLLHQTKIYKELKDNKNIEGPVKVLKCNWKKVQEEKSRIIDRFVKGIEFLLRKNKIEVIKGTASVKNNHQVAVYAEGNEIFLEADKIIFATGSRPADVPFLMPNGREIITSREALELENIPQRMLIVGAGAIGLEMGTIFQRLGSKVSILEIMPTILPGYDKEIVTRLERHLKGQGLKIYTQMKIEKSLNRGGKVFLKGTCLRNKIPFEFEAEKVLLAAGRRPNSEDLGEVGSRFSFDKNGFVKVNSQLETGVPGVYAIGDIIGNNLLAHKASHEGIIAAENASGLKKEIRYDALPMAVFTEPEFASVGMTEQGALEKGINLQVGKFSLQANSRALTIGKTEGMVKIIADEKDRIIGAHILAPNASELIAEMTLVVDKAMSLRDVSSSIHIHPTLSEAVMEAAMNAKNKAIHVLN